MRIKIVGENDTARATRALLRQAGFAVTEFPREDVALNGPQAGYAVTIEEGESSGWIHLDSVDGPLERLVLRHITALSPHPVSLDRPGGEVRSEYRLRIVAPRGDPAQALAVEFGVLRGLLDLLGPSPSSSGSKAEPPPAKMPAPNVPVPPSWGTPAPPRRKKPWYRRLFKASS